MGGVRAAEQRRAARQLGQPRQPHARQRPPQLRRGARAGRADRGRHARARRIAAAFDEVGAHIEGVRFRAAIAEAMRASSLANQYVAEQAPWALVKTDRERAATVLYVALRCVDSLKTLLAPFLPFTLADRARAARLRRLLAGPLEFRTATEEDGSTHEVLTGDYNGWIGAWAPSELPAGPGPARAAAALPQAAARDGSRRARAARPVIDTHAHLDALDDDPAAVVARAREAGVTRILTVGTDVAGCRRALELAEQHEEVYAILGIHPHAAGEATDADIAEVRELLAHPKAVAVGGDGARLVPRLRAARRAADALCVAARRRSRQPASPPSSIRARPTPTRSPRSPASRARVVLHCFSSPHLLEPALERGWYVSFAGNATFPKAVDLRLAARLVPARADPRRDRLRRTSRRSRCAAGRTSPRTSCTRSTSLAQARDEDPRELEQQIDRNAARVLRAVKPPEEVARPALPRRREHPRRDRPARGARS